MGNTSTNQPPANVPLPDYAKLVPIIGSYAKWRILAALITEGQAAGDIAKINECSVSAASKHMKALVDAGLVVQGKGRVYNLAPAYRPKSGERVLDFGHCVLRFGMKAE